MPRPVFPVVRLPYDQPDRVTRVLEAVRREFVAAASRRQPPAVSRADDASGLQLPGTMTAPRVQQPQTVEPAAERFASRPPTEMTQPRPPTTGAAADDQTVDQVTVGVRDCTLTPKVRPDILVTAGGAPTRNAYFGGNEQHDDDEGFCNGGGGGGGGSPYLLVPPVNITAEISRPPLTPLQYYTATSS